MAENSKIEWTHHTINMWFGCTKVSPGCDFCYAENFSNRFGPKVWGNDKPRRIIKSAFNNLLKFQRLAEKAGEIHRVFIGSMKDIYEKPMRLVELDSSYGVHDYPGDTGQLRDELFRKIDDGLYPNLQLLLLTKRSSNIRKYNPEGWFHNPPENVMFGTSPVNQDTYDTLVPHLLQVPGKHFLSMEPLLGPVDMGLGRQWSDGEVWGDMIDWVIVGGESGNNSRPMHPDWVKSIRDQCEEFNIPFFFKQWGEWAPGHSKDEYSETNPLTCINKSGELSWWAGDIFNEAPMNHSENYREGDQPIERLGKKESGRLLDGKLYDGLPATWK